MKQRIGLAYSGSVASSAAVRWLLERHAAEVVTVTLDLGQSEPLDEVRKRALLCGAARAHVIDVRETFARAHVLAALRAGRAASAAALGALAHPAIADTLVEVADIEGADAVAHASRTPALDERIAALAPALAVVAPAHEWRMDARALLAYAPARGPVGSGVRESHMLIRRAVDPARAPETAAHLEIAFEAGAPVAINGVPMALQELLESLSLIAGQHGIGHGDEVCAPAAVVLRAAYGALEGADGVARVSLHQGTYAVSTPPSAVPSTGELVNHP